MVNTPLLVEEGVFSRNDLYGLTEEEIKIVEGHP
jgi:hypothetical protein